MPDMLQEQVLLGLTLYDWTRLAASALAGWILLLVVRRVAVRRIRRLADRTANRVDDIVVEVLESLRAFFLILLSVLAGAQVFGLEVPHLLRVVLLAGFLQAGLTGNRLIGAAGTWYAEAVPDDPTRVTAARAVQLLARLVLWSLLVILVLDNLGVDITALVTGLGIGGVAVALAVQNVLKDVLAYISIMVDRPFVIDDFLMVGDLMGTVEAIGIKSTRLRSISGEQLVFSNEDLLSSRIRNYKRMYERRVLFGVGVEYGTPADRLEAIPGMLRAAIEAHEHVRFDRAHLKGFGASSIDFEAVYYVLVPEYVTMMDIQQAINLRLVREFEREGISFAFPTQTLHVASMPKS